MKDINMKQLTLKPLSWWQEFRTFAFKGNMFELAVAVVLGGAFGKVVESLVKNVIMPLINPILPEGGYQDVKLGPVEMGKFLSELVNFLVIAVAMYVVMVKVFGALRKALPPPPPGECATKECPLCLSLIPFKAKKCGHCTADLQMG